MSTLKNIILPSKRARASTYQDRSLSGGAMFLDIGVGQFIIHTPDVRQLTGSSFVAVGYCSQPKTTPRRNCHNSAAGRATGKTVQSQFVLRRLVHT